MISAVQGPSHGIYGVHQQKRTFHQWINKVHLNSQVAWTKLKAAFAGDSPTVRFLKQARINDLDRLAHLTCTLNPFSYEGQLLRRHLRNINDKAFIESIFDKMFDSSNVNFEKISSFFSEAQLRNMLNNEPEFHEILAEFANNCLPKASVLKQTIPSKIAKTLQVVSRFFPNFMDTVLKAFSLIDAGKGPQTIWDFAAMLEIYYKMFMIPFAIFVVVGYFVAIPLLAIGITALSVLTLVVGISIYLKFRPCPNKLSFCRNLTQEAKDCTLTPVIGREHLINQISSALGTTTRGNQMSILLVGKPGTGKSALVRGVAAKNRNKNIHALDSTAVTGGYSIQNAMQIIRIEIKGHENKIVLFIDEFGDAAKNNRKANITGLIKPLVEGGGVQVITICTEEEYRTEILTVEGLADRFHIINVEGTSKLETLEILNHDMEMNGTNCRFENNLAQQIWNETQNKSQPRASVMALAPVINTINNWDIAGHKSEELQQKKTQLRMAKNAYRAGLNGANRRQLSADITRLNQEYQILKKQNKDNISLAIRIKDLIKRCNQLTLERDRLSRGQDKKDLIFLNWFLLPWMERKITEILKNIPRDIPMEVSMEMIRKNLGR